MRLTKTEKSEHCRKHRLSGMTLIEVTVGMVIIIIVTLIAYMGVSASANFTARGTDLRNADGPAVSMLEAEKEKASKGKIAVTAVDISYQVNHIIYSRAAEDSDDTVMVTSVIQNNGNLKAGLIEAEVTDNDVVVRYDMYLPVTEAPVDTP